MVLRRLSCPGIRDTKRTVTFTNGVTNTFDQDFKVNYGTFNVTGNAGLEAPVPRRRQLLAVRNRSAICRRMTGRTSLTRPDQYLRGTKGDRNTYSGSVDYIRDVEPDVLGARRPLPDRQPEHRRHVPRLDRPDQFARARPRAWRRSPAERAAHVGLSRRTC